jgi:hypothetical protein
MMGNENVNQTSSSMVVSFHMRRKEDIIVLEKKEKSNMRI